MNDTGAQVEHEVEIVWEEPPEQYDYVRVRAGRAGTRTRSVPFHRFKRVGYAVLADDAPNIGRPGQFRRRVFWLKDHDRAYEPDGVYANQGPSEAVDPRTVAPGVRGEKTERVEPDLLGDSNE